VPDRPQLTWSKDSFEGVAVGDDTIGCTYCHGGRLPTGKATNRQIPTRTYQRAHRRSRQAAGRQIASAGAAGADRFDKQAEVYKNAAATCK
jgi:hypothetical protein